MPSYYLAPCLVQLRAEVNARWPARDKASDGWIGDASHNARRSDHNPDPPGTGVVRALDVDASGINADALVAMATMDPRVNYVIYNRRIYSRVRLFAGRAYTGSNPHTSHVHISIRHGREYETNVTPWFPRVVAPTVPPSTPKPVVRPSAPKPTPVRPKPVPFTEVILAALPSLSLARKSTGAHVKTVQALLNARGGFPGAPLKLDGSFGPATNAAVRDKQKDFRVKVDGDVGPITWRHLLNVA